MVFLSRVSFSSPFFSSLSLSRDAFEARALGLLFRLLPLLGVMNAAAASLRQYLPSFLPLSLSLTLFFPRDTLSQSFSLIIKAGGNNAEFCKLHPREINKSANVSSHHSVVRVLT